MQAAVFSLALLLLCGQLRRLSCLTFDTADYPEVYPDPTDQAFLNGRTPLYFALIQSLGGPLSQFDGSGSVAGVKVALDRINNDSSLLPGYTLHYTFADSKCNRTEGFNSFFSQILREPTKLAVIGSGCSVTTEPTAEISHYYNISQISCVSSSTELRNRVRFPNYFQLLSTEETLAFAYYGVIKAFKWKRVALIIQNENLFTVTIDRLKVLLDRDEVDHNTRLFETSTGISGLGDNIFDENSRIFLFAMYSVNARPLLCEAYKRNIRLPQHLLLTPAWYSRFWWRVDDENLPCTVQQRESVLPSSLAFLHFKFLNETADANLTTSSGITGEEYLAEEKQFLGRAPLNLTFLEYSQYCYDATWTLAFALNATLNSLDNATLNAEIAQAHNMTPPLNLEDFSYCNRRLLEVIFGHLKSTEFRGITGPVSFGDQGIRNLNELFIFQFRNVINASTGATFLNWVGIGDVVPSGVDDYEFVYKDGENIDTVWNGLVPYDGVPLKVFVTIHVSLTVIFTILAVAGIAFAVACLVFNFVYRKTKLIKLASSKLNYFIGIGAIILYLNTIIFVIPRTTSTAATILCNITPLLTAIGYSLCYGTILAKMARVYYIFTNPSPNKKGIQDWMLMLVVGVLVGIDLTVIVVYLGVEGSRSNLGAKLVGNGKNPQDVQGELGIITNYCIYICDSLSRDIFLAVLYGYKMALQMVSLLFAFSIRRVKIKGLDDAKYIAGSIYVTSIVLAVTIVVTYSLKEVVNAYNALICTGFLIGTSVILGLVFLPLMVGLYKDPKGDNIFTKSSIGNPDSLQNAGLSESVSLKKRISELETELATLKHPKKKPAVPDSKSSISKVLESSNIKDKTERTFTGTIWDVPEEGEQTTAK